MPARTALKGMKSARVSVRDQARERGFADAGRSPQDERLQLVALDLNAQRFSGREDVLLADETFPGVGTHALGQRTLAFILERFERRGIEQAHGTFLWRRAS